ncbi:phosphonate ABC transporter, permease protein PhnE [Phaeovulum vinaykumarii]|uniref:Phosphonate transport system permease protein n=1 Tax=Phaeovulum vinaykumarii TaxID=407234 RepID=A0A1N7LXJ7_9RHOB|nr:phosphonate transport system permease protein [Phaeovulum vinaykumarii]SOC06978.1 phosphonate transport system permease protein [Phaeovulum vinaykumarii]
MSTTLTPAAAAPADPALRARVHGAMTRRRRLALALPVLLLAYLAYVFVAFDVAGIASRARPENAATLLNDFWSHKTHVTRDNRSDTLQVAIEGENKGTYPDGQTPAWVHTGPTSDGPTADGTTAGGETVIDLPDGSRITYGRDISALIERPDFGTIRVARVGRDITLELPPGAALPDWISASARRVNVTGPGWRFSMTNARTETFRYAPGWELFFFTLESPFAGRSLPDLVALALWEPRLDPARPNLAGMADDFWNNRMWRHGDVVWALGETVLMAFLGTMGAGLIALPLAFLAASNFAPARLIRLALRRMFDFFRGVDGLIWTVILSRAFGPGPMTGALAILMTDTGTFGKTFSEALENIDTRQVEGVGATGANALQRARFGVMPQVAPVILSQLLYYLESNTRSATVIGALVGGGIGLLLTQAINTQKDWEEVCYYIVLIVGMVMAMDSLSGWLRRRFIKG